MADGDYHHGDLPAALLRAVDEIIAEDGVGAVSIRAVARRAGVSHAAPSHHFGDRAGLLAAYAADGFVQLRDAMVAAFDRLPDGASGLTALRAIGEAYVAFGMGRPGVYNAMFRPEQMDCTAPRLVHAGGCAFAVLLATCRTCLDEDATDDDVLAVSMAAWSGVHGFVSLQVDLPSAEVNHLPEVHPLLGPVLDLAMAGLAAHPRWIGDDVPATAVPAGFADPLVPVDDVAEALAG